MSGESVSVSKLTPKEIEALTSWNFISSYKKYHNKLVELARTTYRVTCGVLNCPPTQAQFYESFSRALLWTNLFSKQIVGRKYHIPSSLYEYYAGLLAKYVLEQDWAEISSVPCP